MLKIEKTQTYGWEAAVRGMRNPKNSWNKMDSTFSEAWLDIHNIGPNDMKLMQTLINAGTMHRKFLRMITVTCDITAPLYWWKEFDTYKVGTVANSCSTMHKVIAKEFTNEDFSNEEIMKVQEMAKFAVTHRDPSRELLGEKYYDIGYFWQQELDMLNSLRKMYLNTEDAGEKYHYWKALIQLLPTNYMQKRTIQLNYEVLRGMMRPDCRLHHKLTEWSVNFVDWVRTLPYADELIFQKEE